MEQARVFTDEELAALARSPHQEVVDALADQAELTATVDKLTRRFEGVMVGLRTWVATILAFVAETSGVEGLAAAVSDEAPFLQRAAVDVPGVTVDAIVAAAAAGAGDEAVGQWDQLESYYRVHHDWWVDRVSVLLSHVYRTHGVDGLERCLRSTGRDFLLPWMPHDIVHPARRRLRVWVETAKGNMSTIAGIVEDDQKFTITMDPCGSCGRQAAERGFPGPYGLAVVAEDAPITSGHGGMGVYRTHVAVIHHLIPLERRGVPWPVINCPGALEGGPCRTYLFKDPDNPAAIALLPG
jgi:hypothetical protein